MDPARFQEFLAKGPACACKELRREPRNQRAFLRHLLQIVPLQGGQAQAGGAVLSEEEYTAWLEWLITSPGDNETPKEYIARVQEQYGAKSNVCGRIWGKGYVAYRCRTCGMSPCSAICHECFEKGPHRNHNFLMYRSVAGGCCDCGDPGAWKASGFCKSHKGPPDSFHLPMPEVELRGAFNCIYDLVSHVTEALTAHYYNVSVSVDPAPNDELPPYCSKSLKLLQELCTYGDVYRRIVCAATLGDIGLANPALRGGSPYFGETSSSPAAPPLLTQTRSPVIGHRMLPGGVALLPTGGMLPPAAPAAAGDVPAMTKSGSTMSIDEPASDDADLQTEPRSLLECLMLSGTHLSVEISTLFLQMLFDFDFKKKFTRVFIRYYGRFMRTILRLHDKKEIPTRMVDISVQLFSNSLLTVEMIREEALLSTLFRNIMVLIEEQGEPGSDSSHAHITLNCEHAIWTKRTYWPITNDLVNILSHRAVVAEFLFRVDMVKEWLAVARRFQGIDAHVREVGAHIELESRHWTSPFFIELELVMEQLSLLDSGVKDIMTQPVLSEPDEPAADRVQMIAAMRQILAVGMQACKEWLQRDAVGMQWLMVAGERTLPLRFGVHREAVTLHIPLHRFVAFFASQVCRHCDLPLREIFAVDDLPCFMRAVIEHPLRIQVLLAQIRAGLWRLNGETMFRRGWFYRSAYFYDLGFDLDLFVLQCAAVLLHPDELLLTMVDRFGLCGVLGFSDPRPGNGVDDAAAANLPSDDPNVCSVIVEGMLVLIAAILSERARLGLTDSECIRQEVIARLCVKPHSHSQLTESICRRWNEHDNFETVLLDVANFEAPTSHRMEQGKYRLKDEHEGERGSSLVHILVRSFNHGDYEAAMQQLREAEKESKSGPDPHADEHVGAAAAGGSRGGGGSRKLMMPMPAAFRDILFLLHSPVLHHIIYRVLLHTVSGKSPTTSVHIDMALWLLQASLEHPVEAAGGAFAAGSLRWGCVYTSRDIRENMTTVVHVTYSGENDEPDVKMEADGEEGYSILSLLRAMQQSEHFNDARPTPASLLALFGSCSAQASEVATADGKDADAEISTSQESSDSAKKDAKQAAKERQKALLASFAAQQKLFADTMLSESEDEDEEEDEQDDDKVECVICSQSAPPSEDNPVGLICLVQRSTLLADHSQKARQVFTKRIGQTGRGTLDAGPCCFLPANLDSGANLHVQSCGHHIHASCFNSYTMTLTHNQTLREQQRLDSKSGLFLCPLCRQMGNALLPILPRGLKRDSSDVKRQASLLMCSILPQAQTDSYLQAARVEGGRSASIPLGIYQMEAGMHSAQRTFGRALTTAANDFLKRLVEISGNAFDTSESPAETEKLGLELLVRGIGMTLGCMEVCNRAPCAESLGIRATLQSSQERVLFHLRHLHQLAARLHCDIEKRGDSGNAGMGAQLLKSMLRADHGTFSPTHGLHVGWVGTWGKEPMLHDQPQHMQAAGSQPSEPPQTQDTYGRMSAARLDMNSGIGQARLGGYPHGRVLIAAGGPWLSAAPGPEAAHFDMLPGHGDTGMLPMRVEMKDVPFLAMEMNSVLLYVLYSLSASDVDERGPLLLRLVYLGLFVQICMDYNAHFPRSANDSAAIAMDEDSPAEESLESLILAEIRQLELQNTLASSSSGAMSSETSAQAPFERLKAAELGSLESYVYRCSLPFLRRARFLLSIHSGDSLPALAAGSASPGPVSSLKEEWLAAMAALQLPVKEGTPVPAVGEFCKELVRGWLRELAAVQADPRGAVICWPLLQQAFSKPQELGFPLLIPLPDLYHDLYMTYRDHKCRRCQLVPHRPALCLICGDLVCFASDCCCIGGESGSTKLFECFHHADQCHAGTGTYVILKSSMVLVIRERHWCQWGSPYLDAYGEEDQDLRRGRPLYLNRERYQQLQLLHSTHGFDHNSRVASNWQAGAHRY